MKVAELEEENEGYKMRQHNPHDYMTNLILRSYLRHGEESALPRRNSQDPAEPVQLTEQTFPSPSSAFRLLQKGSERCDACTSSLEDASTAEEWL